MSQKDALMLADELVTQTIMNNSEDTIYFKNLDSVFILNSKAHANQFNEKDPRDMLGKSDYDYFPAEFVDVAIKDERSIIASGEPVLGRIERWDKPNGETIWFQAYKYPLYDKQGKIIGTWGTSRNITPLMEAEEELKRLNIQLREANKRLENLSIRDSLSGLYNHRHFFNTLEELDHRLERYGHSYAIILLDVDNFKTVNDTYGHLFGDAVIQWVSNLINRSTRLEDLCFRIGGDEFGIILQDGNIENARLAANKLCTLAREHSINDDGHSANITFSLGVASSDEVMGAKIVYELADQRMYISKENGKNQVN